MCEMLNLLVPTPAAVAPPAIRGLAFSGAGEVQRDFAARYPRGTPFVATCSTGCLCGFRDWDAVYEAASYAMEANQTREVALLHFWSGDRYTLTERGVDPDDAEALRPLIDGEVVVLRTDHPGQRRHRRLLRELTRAIGTVVDLRLKSGRTLHGVLVAFDAESEVGRVDARVFVAAEVLEPPMVR
jgi:hypothetical protein